MTIHLSENARRFIAEQVASGRYPSEDALLEDAVEHLRRQGSPADQVDASARRGLVGSFHDDAELLDEVVEDSMRDREMRPWRLPAGE